MQSYGATFSQHHDGGEAQAHPYDMPFAMIQSLRKDVADLKAMHHAEQQQRAAEVQELRGEVKMLREALRAEVQSLHGVTQKLVTEVGNSHPDFGKSIDELRLQQRQTLEQLNAVIQDEIRDRKACENLRDTREQSRVTEFKTALSNIQSELAQHKQTFLTFKDDQVNDVNNLIHDVEFIMGGLTKVALGKDPVELQGLNCYGAGAKAANQPVIGFD